MIDFNYINVPISTVKNITTNPTTIENRILLNFRSIYPLVIWIESSTIRSVIENILNWAIELVVTAFPVALYSSYRSFILMKKVSLTLLILYPSSPVKHDILGLKILHGVED